MKTLAKIGCACAFLLPVPVQAADSRPVLEPTGNWVLDYAEERCSLNRRFAVGDKWLHLRIDSYGSRQSYSLMMFGSAVPGSVGADQEIRYKLSPDAGSRDARALAGRYERDSSLVIPIMFKPREDEPDWARLSREERLEFAATPEKPDIEFEREVSSLELSLWRGRRFTLALGSMGKPLEAMRVCVDNLLSSWGLDADQQATLTRAAAPLPRTVRAVQARYPTSMLLSGTNGLVPVRIMVDALGSATSCVVQVDSVEDAFERAVCDGLTGAYQPALDSRGAPVASVYRTSVIYIIQG